MEDSWLVGTGLGGVSLQAEFDPPAEGREQATVFLEFLKDVLARGKVQVKFRQDKIQISILGLSQLTALGSQGISPRSENSSGYRICLSRFLLGSALYPQPRRRSFKIQ